MWMLIVRGVIAGAVIVGVTALAQHSPKWGAFLLTLPLISIVAFLSTWQQKHDMRAISQVARETLELVDRAYILHEGVVLMEGLPSEIVVHEDVRRVYLGERFSL